MGSSFLDIVPPEMGGEVGGGGGGAVGWGGSRSVSQKRMIVAAMGTFAVVLLIAFGFAKQATMAVTAFLGGLMMLAGAYAILYQWRPEYLGMLPGRSVTRYGALLALTGLGILIQWRLWWPRKAKPAAGK